MPVKVCIPNQHQWLQRCESTYKITYTHSNKLWWHLQPSVCAALWFNRKCIRITNTPTHIHTCIQPSIYTEIFFPVGLAGRLARADWHAVACPVQFLHNLILNWTWRMTEMHFIVVLNTMRGRFSSLLSPSPSPLFIPQSHSIEMSAEIFQSVRKNSWWNIYIY